MKLLQKINRYSLLFIIALAPVMIAVDYYLIRFLVNKEVNEILIHEKDRITFNLEQNKKLPHSDFLWMNLSDSLSTDNKESFRDTLIHEKFANRLVPYRTYEFSIQLNNENRRIVLRHILWEINELIWWLFLGTALVLLMLSFGLFLINRNISKLVWKPFFNNLSKLKHYDLSQKGTVNLRPSGITEFQALNKVIINLMNRIKTDFQKLKEFNENISHEIQTPLAIIRNKMVLLLENQNFSKKELTWIQAAYEEANKLSKIGKSLTLISRIENEEFTKLKNININDLIENILNNMQEILAFKNIQLSTALEPIHIKCDPILANILFTNLIKNAVQHNYEGGYIKLEASGRQFKMENSGEILEKDTAQLFHRFEREKKSPENLGLGLSISQRICELYGFQLEYKHEGGKHFFTLDFS